MWWFDTHRICELLWIKIVLDDMEMDIEVIL